MSGQTQSRSVTFFALLLALFLGSLSAAAQTSPPHVHSPSSINHEGQTLCLTCPVAREGSGTSWQPDVSTAHQHATTFRGWRLQAHARVLAVTIDERGPRGGSDLFSVNHVMVNATRGSARSVWGVRSMFSIEPLMGALGYPLLGQTGETADGVSPLIDRQHPHDFPMELALTYARASGVDQGFYLYIAAVGAPALGPPAFMHRASAAALPIAPITHHGFDSLHLSHGVVTAGFVSSPKVKFEASLFNGREPDQNRWGIEFRRLDSFAARVSINPTPSIAIQVSTAILQEPERLQPGADSARLTASMLYSRQWSGVTLDAMVAWARTARRAEPILVANPPAPRTSVAPEPADPSPSRHTDGALQPHHTTPIAVPGGFYFATTNVAPAVLAEATLRFGLRHAVTTRGEYTEKDELFDISDSRHNTPFPMSRFSAGYSLDVIRASRIGVSIGGAVSVIHVGSEIRSSYGGSPVSWLGFAAIDVR